MVAKCYHGWSYVASFRLAGVAVDVYLEFLGGLALGYPNYLALNVIINDAFPEHRISADTILHFGPPAGIILAAQSTRDFRFLSMPPSTILPIPLSS
jgi:hypothetical protein